MADNTVTKTESSVFDGDSSVGIFSLLKAFLKRCSAWIAVYLFGYYNFSYAWLLGPLILSVVREQWRKEQKIRRTIAQTIAGGGDKLQKQLILARVGDLPSWVFFPDLERAEWLNRILQQLWPNFSAYMKNLIVQTIEPTIRESLKEYHLGSFKFERLILGTIPPRVGGIKVYDRNIDRNEIIMDMEIFYAGDCDLQFSVKRIKAGIKDFQINGKVRVVMTPLLRNIPLVGGLQVFFLNNPNVDFNLVGIADILDIPGLSDVLHKVVVEQIAAWMVLPNKFPIALAENIPMKVLKFPEPAGVLRVCVIEAKDLMKKDVGVLGMGKSDPYAVISVGAQEFKTVVINNTINPKWDYYCEFTCSVPMGQIIHLDLFDKDEGTMNKDEYLGGASVDILQVIQSGEKDMWVKLEDAKTGIAHMQLFWFSLSEQISDLPAAQQLSMQHGLTMSSALLMVYIDCVKNLPHARSMSKPDAYVQLTLGSHVEKTYTQFRTGDPIYEQGFTFLINNPEADDLYVKVFDEKSSTELGDLKFTLSTLLKEDKMEIDNQPFTLKNSGSETKIALSLQLKILKKAEKKNIPEDYEGSSFDAQEQEQKSAVVDPPSLAVDQTSSEGSQNLLPKSTATTVLEKDGMQEVEGSATSVSSPACETPADTLTPPPKLNSPPSLDEMLTATVAPVLEVADMNATPAVNENGQVRRRTNASIVGDMGLGRVQMTLRYSEQRHCLVIVIHQAKNLPGADNEDLPDPYVKLYLLPDRSKDSKRKTEVIKDNVNPVYDQTFEYDVSRLELAHRQLEISVVSKKGIFSHSPVLGQVIIDLSQYDMRKAFTEWFDLQPEK